VASGEWRVASEKRRKTRRRDAEDAGLRRVPPALKLRRTGTEEAGRNRGSRRAESSEERREQDRSAGHGRYWTEVDWGAGSEMMGGACPAGGDSRGGAGRRNLVWVGADLAARLCVVAGWASDPLGLEGEDPGRDWVVRGLAAGAAARGSGEGAVRRDLARADLAAGLGVDAGAASGASDLAEEERRRDWAGAGLTSFG